MTFGNQVGVPLAKKLLKQCFDAGVNLCARSLFRLPLLLLLPLAPASCCAALHS